MNKRGLAPVISVALITLGVVVAVTFLWVFASNTISPKNRAINPDCFTTDLSVSSCQTYGVCAYVSGSGAYEADVLVKRGTGKANVTGIRFSFEDPLGRKIVQDANLTSLLPGYSLEELQSLRFNNYPARISSPSPNSTLRVVPLIGENYEVCPTASKPATCNSVSISPPQGSIPGATNNVGQCCQCPQNFSQCYNGNDPRYPIINGIVNLDPDVVLDSNGNVISNGAMLPSTYQYPTPPGNFSVCCSVVPPSVSGNPMPDGNNYPPVGSSCPVTL